MTQQQTRKLTQTQVEYATRDLQTLLKESAAIKAVFHACVAIGNMDHLFRVLLRAEITENWQVSNVDAFETVFTDFVRHTVVKKQITVSDLRAQVLEILLPLIDLMVPMEQKNDVVHPVSLQADSTSIPGSDDHTVAGAHEAPESASSDAIQEA